MTVKLELESGGYDFTVQDGRLTVAYAEGYTADGSGSGQPGGEAPVVENVVITPDSAELEKGQTQQFTAEVTGQNDPSQDVIWSVEGAESDNTAISADGVLTVGDGETAEELTVTAVSAADETVSASVTVTIKIDEEPGGEPGEPEDPDKPGTEDPFLAAADCLSGFRFSNRKCIHFQTSAQSTIPVSADKVLSSFLPV